MPAGSERFSPKYPFKSASYPRLGRASSAHSKVADSFLSDGPSIIFPVERITPFVNDETDSACATRFEKTPI